MEHKVSSPQKNTKKNFLSNEDKQRIIAWKNQRKGNAEIANLLNISKRQVSSFLMQIESGQTNEWDREEMETLYFYYRNGVCKESQLKKYLPKKSVWMIRNKIKSLIKRGCLGIPLNLESTCLPFDALFEEICNDQINYHNIC